MKGFSGGGDSVVRQRKWVGQMGFRVWGGVLLFLDWSQGRSPNNTTGLEDIDCQGNSNRTKNKRKKWSKKVHFCGNIVVNKSSEGL